MYAHGFKLLHQFTHLALGFDAYCGLYRLQKFLEYGYQRGFLILGVKYVPWHTFQGAEVIENKPYEYVYKYNLKKNAYDTEGRQ